MLDKSVMYIKYGEEMQSANDALWKTSLNFSDTTRPEIPFTSIAFLYIIIFNSYNDHCDHICIVITVIKNVICKLGCFD